METVADIKRAKQEDKLGIVFHFQGTNPIESNVQMVEVYYRLGIRHMLMAYNLRNPIGDGCKERMDSGLSHLVVFENDKQEFLNDVFLNSEKYPYLQLEFDSRNNGFSNNILIYKIDYEIFNDIIE